MKRYSVGSERSRMFFAVILVKGRTLHEQEGLLNISRYFHENTGLRWIEVVNFSHPSCIGKFSYTMQTGEIRLRTSP